jgi:hypothetical protein
MRLFFHLLAILGALSLVTKVNAQSCPIVYTGSAPTVCQAYDPYTGSTYTYDGPTMTWMGASEPRPPYYGQGYVCWPKRDLRAHCAEPAQPSDPNMRNVYRFYYRTQSGNVSDHYITGDYYSGWLWGAEYENRLFRVLVNPTDSDMIPLYMCFGNWGDHWADTDPSCAGHTYIGMHGYISTIPRAGYVPLYRFVRLNPWDFIETTDWNEVAAWQQGGYEILGYVPQ